MAGGLVPTEEASGLVERLSRARWAGRYPQPAFSGSSLPNVGVSAYRRAGGNDLSGLLPPLDERYLASAEDGDTTVVFLLDGFGWNAYEALLRETRSGSSRRLAEGLRERTLPITSVFPSSTSSALISLSQGVAPGTHGIVGYTEYFPQWGSILNTLKFNAPWGGSRDAAIGRFFHPRDLVPTPSLFQRGISSTALTHLDFEGTAFTRALYDGAKFEGYVSLSDLSHHLARLLSQPRASRPRLLWVYWPLLDAVGHVNGPLPNLLASEVKHVMLALASCAASLSPGDREGVHLFVTGDHGQVEVEPSKARAVHADPKLLELLQRPPSLERRASLFQAREGKREELRTYLEGALGPDWPVLAVPEVIAGGLFGPPPHHPELAARLGDLLVLPPPGHTIWYRPPGARGPEDRFQKGSHGGLTPQELLVALVSAPFEDVARWDA